jgi:hypothetical protein
VAFEANSPYRTAGTDFDQLVVTGAVDLRGATLRITGGTAAAAPGQVVTLIDHTTADPTTPASNPAEGSTITLGSATFRISYHGGDGNNVTLTAPSAPTVAVPGHQTAYEDVDKAISGITVGDVDGGSLTVTLAVTKGKLTLGTTAGLTVTGNGTARVTLSGGIAELNAALASLVYRGGLNYSGPDTLTVTVSDDGGLSASKAVAITVKSAAEQAADLQAQVAALRDAGVLNGGQANALIVKLNLKGNAGDIGKVQSFLDQVRDFLRAGILTQERADSLLVPGNILLLSVTRR